MSITLIWPLEEPVPDLEQAWEIYGALNPFFEPSSVADWIDRCVDPHFKLAERIGLKPFTIVHDYSYIDETGEFPDEPHEWFSPEELEQSVLDFMSKMGMNDEDAMVMCEYWIREIREKGDIYRGDGPMPKILPGEDPYLVGIWRTKALGLLIANMESIVIAARTCRNKGVKRLAFGLFG